MYFFFFCKTETEQGTCVFFETLRSSFSLSVQWETNVTPVSSGRVTVADCHLPFVWSKPKAHQTTAMLQ